MSWLLIIVLIVIGLILLLVEMLLMPGTAIAGILGLVAIGFSVYETYSFYGAKAGTLLLLGTLIISVIAIVLALRSKTWNKVMLKASIDSKVINNLKPRCVLDRKALQFQDLLPQVKDSLIMTFMKYIHLAALWMKGVSLK